MAGGDAPHFRRRRSPLRRGAADVPRCRTSLIKLNYQWAQELCIYMFVWMAKFGAAYGVRTGIHVGVDVLINRLTTERCIAMYVLFGLLRRRALHGHRRLAGRHVRMGHRAYRQVSPDLEMPKWIVYLAVPLGSYLMCFRFLQVAWSFRNTGELPHHDHATSRASRRSLPGRSPAARSL